MWGGTDDDAAVAAIEKAIDLGMTTIDTAAIYGFGHSEQIVGKAIAGKRGNVQILTKYGMRWDCTDGELAFESTGDSGKCIRIHRNARRESVISECEQSLKRLGTDAIDLYQCHWRDPTTPVEETMAAIDKLLKDGKIRAAGVSNFTVEDIAAAQRVVPIAANQPPYGVLRRDIERDVLPYCVENNIGLLTYSPLQRGLLTGKVTMDRIFRKGDNRANSKLFQPENRRRVLEFLERIRPIAEGHNATLAQLAINWTIHRPGITVALVGARSPQQVEENARAADTMLSEGDVGRIDDELDRLQLEA